MNFPFQFVILFLVHSSLCEPVPKNSLTHILDYGGKQYYYAKYQNNFFDAYTFCRLEGMQLVAITSASEQSAIEEVLEPEGDAKVWTSGNRLSGSDYFVWLSTGRIFLYENWATGEPNNDGDDGLCVAIGQNGTWGNTSCDVLNYFICEEISNPC